MTSRTLLHLSRIPSRLTTPTTTTRNTFLTSPILLQRTLPPLFKQPLIRRPSSSSSSSSSPSQLPILSPPEYLNPLESAIFTKLTAALSPIQLEVQDISGGCGSMYALDIVSEQFTGLSVMKQHRLVNGILGEEIKGWHGVQLKTRAP